MKIAAAFALIVALLLGMIVGLGWLQGEFGDGPDNEMTGTEVAYLEFVVTRLEFSGANLGNLGYLIANPDFDNEEWRVNAYLVVNQLQAAFADVANVVPTERLAPFHEASLEALAKSAKFAELTEKAFQEESTDISREAMQALVDANNAYAEADALLTEFLDSHTIPESHTAPAS